MAARFSIVNETGAGMPSASFRAIKEAVLGRSYSLNVVFIAPREMRKLNSIYRGKNFSTDILSFPLSKSQGEIYISLFDARKEARRFGRDYLNFIAFLFIHGCVHLKGYGHSSRMEAVETKIRKIFMV